MNGLSDALTIGLVIILVFGAISFYLYSRIGQVEKRVSLTENILLDLKMATENTLMAMGGAHQAHGVEEHPDATVVNVGAPVKEEEHVNDEDFYKSVLEQSAAAVTAGSIKTEAEMVAAPTSTDDIPFLSGSQSSGSKVDVNYESMTLKELKALVKQRGIAAGNATHKKDYIDLLRKQGGASSMLEPVPGSFGGPMGNDEGGFPVDLGSAENRNAQQE